MNHPRLLVDTLAVEAGMTEDEARCFELTGFLAQSIFALPVLHASDNEEVSRAIHLIQNALMSRVFYKKYSSIP